MASSNSGGSSAARNGSTSSAGHERRRLVQHPPVVAVDDDAVAPDPRLGPAPGRGSPGAPTAAAARPMPVHQSVSVSSRSNATARAPAIDIRRACHRPGLQSGHDPNTCSLPVHGLRPRVAEVARPLPGVRRVGLARGRGARRAASGSRRADPSSRPVPLAEVDPRGAPRRPTGVAELDRVLGGGLVAGSVTLIGGEPGMGKSTLVLQALGRDGRRRRPLPARVRRGVGRPGAAARRPARHAAPTISSSSRRRRCPTSCAHVEAAAAGGDRDRLDPGRAGSRRAGRARVGRAGARRRAASCSGSPRISAIATLLVGHVTKDGSLAGPRTLEHVVDTVLSFEGDRHHALRMLRALKHRFGPTDELGLMEMTGEGLVSVARPERVVPRRSPARARAGSVVAAVLEGTRPLCVEVQALVADTPAPMPRRVAQSFDGGRLAMLVAILQQRAGVALAGQDVYASVAGGVRVAEPGADLAVALAIASARDDRAGRTPTRSSSASSASAVRCARCRRSAAGSRRRSGSASRRAIVPASTPDVAGIQLAPSRRSRDRAPRSRHR